MISVILPAYNEQDSIGKVITDINAVLKGKFEYEILVIDDCSPDGTAALAKAKGARVIKHLQNRGSGASRKTGIKNAKGDIILMMDADGTYPADAIPQMLDFFPDYDQVIGARKAEKGTIKIMRAPAKWFLRNLAMFLTKQNIPDLNSGMRAFKKDLMMKYLHIIPNGFSCVSTMTIAFLSDGLNVKFTPINYFKRFGGKSKFHPIKDSKAYFFTIIRIVMYFNPLRIILPVSAALFFLAMLKTVYDLILKGNMVTSTLILYLASLLVGMIGLLADLIVTENRKFRAD